MDIDPEIAKIEAKNGEPISYGDATQENVLQDNGIDNAKVMVIAISDRAATRRITDLARRLNPDIYIIARTRYIQEMEVLQSLGANEVIPEEYETSVEIFSRVLEKYDVPRDGSIPLSTISGQMDMRCFEAFPGSLTAIQTSI